MVFVFLRIFLVDFFSCCFSTVFVARKVGNWFCLRVSGVVLVGIAVVGVVVVVLFDMVKREVVELRWVLNV